MSVEIKLSRSNRIYRPNEPVEGKIVTKLSSSISHQGIRLKVNASVNLQVRGGSAGVIESFYGVIKPITILNKTVEVLKSGRISSGSTEIPFSFWLKDPGEKPLEKFYETYHGGDISIQYLVSVDISRGYLHKSLSATMEFIIESEKGLENLPEKPISPEMVIFYMTQDTQRHSLLPELKSGGFRVSGKMCTLCSLSDPIEGELTIESSAVPIQSIDIHLLRLESILVGEKIATESSLIQTTQIADGDVCRGMTLPIYIILPRLLTCPSIFAGPFSIEFKVTLVITFQSEQSKVHSKSNFKTLKSWHAAESIPLELIRTK
ncbi:Down syndrome critical region protein 3 isoform X1 [Solanum pennellii]|uniref:Down syndrome critical region protein 3 isoform X1 n=1 Tax=Solanum pennellii TaxID=28526 RepID=A0ABM1V7P2_SOLPN|nr:Down syndrome critical region protein 3 isoform X1 [Solanum pennellii]